MAHFAPLSRTRRHLRLVTVTIAAGIGGAVFVLAYFQPQDLFIDHTVNEALPVPVSTAAPVAGTPTAAAPAPAAATTGPTARIVAQGRFRSGEHATTGTAQLIDAPGRGVLLRLSSFRTSNGPAVHVWLS